MSYTVGREAATTYSESLNGVQVGKAVHHQLVRGVDPYQMQGDPSSGLLPHIDSRAQEPRALRTIAYKPTAFECT